MHMAVHGCLHVYYNVMKRQKHALICGESVVSALYNSDVGAQKEGNGPRTTCPFHSIAHIYRPTVHQLDSSDFKKRDLYLWRDRRDSANRRIAAAESCADNPPIRRC